MFVCVLAKPRGSQGEREAEGEIGGGGERWRKRGGKGGREMHVRAGVCVFGDGGWGLGNMSIRGRRSCSNMSSVCGERG